MANVKGPLPPGPRALGPRPAAKKGAGRASPRAQGAARAKDHGQLVDDDELAQAAGFARAHAAELEEEGRRHASGDAEAERAREAEREREERKVQGFAFDDERKRRGRNPRDDDEDTEDAEAVNEAAKAAKERGLISDESSGRYFLEMPADRLGDPSLTDPNEMKRQLGPSVRFAQHAMLLAHERLQASHDRADALAFLADIYVRVQDRAYANKALREFGPATGIVDLYPLELMDHLLRFVPGFCTKVSRDAWVTDRPSGGFEAKAGEVIRLNHDPQLRLRGFAIQGGARPGYLLEPVDPPGTSQLVFLTGGRFTVLMSAIAKDGHLYLDTFDCHIEDGPAKDVLPGLAREREHDRKARELADGEAASGRDKKKDDLTIHFPRRI